MRFNSGKVDAVESHWCNSENVHRLGLLCHIAILYDWFEPQDALKQSSLARTILAVHFVGGTCETYKLLFVRKGVLFWGTTARATHFGWKSSCSGQSDRLNTNLVLKYLKIVNMVSLIYLHRPTVWPVVPVPVLWQFEDEFWVSVIFHGNLHKSQHFWVFCFQAILYVLDSVTNFEIALYILQICHNSIRMILRLLAAILRNVHMREARIFCFHMGLKRRQSYQ